MKHRKTTIIAGLVALAGGWTVLVADSSNEQCGVTVGYDVTYGYSTTCMGAPASGQITISAPGDKSRGVSPKEGGEYSSAVPAETLAAIRAQGLNVATIEALYDTTECQHLEGHAKPTGFALRLYGTPVALPVTAGTTPLFQCDESGAALTESTTISCVSVDWQADQAGDVIVGEPSSPAATCQLTLTFTPQ
jgi:hypothetical protein